MSGLTNYDLAWCLTRLPFSVRGFLQNWNTQLVVAGGFIRGCIANEPISDIDLFATSKEEAHKAALALATTQEVVAKPHTTDNAYTIKLAHLQNCPIQFIHRWTFTAPEPLIQSFDFTIARAAFWWNKEEKKWGSLVDPNFYHDLAAKRLVYCSPVREEEAGGSLLRVLKFYQKGYRIPLDSFGAVLSRMFMGIKEDCLPHGLEREEAIAKVLTGLLREVDPSIDPERVAHLPSKSELAQ